MSTRWPAPCVVTIPLPSVLKEFGKVDVLARVFSYTTATSQVSHGHTLALIEAGSSSRHLRAHVRDRIRLDHKIQIFLGEHGEAFAAKFYRAETQESSEQALQRYGDHSRAVHNSYALFVAASMEKTKLFRLVDGGQLRAFEDEQGLSSSNSSSALNFVADRFRCCCKVSGMRQVGYAKKFPFGSATVWGIGASFSASGSFNLKKFLQGRVSANFALNMGFVAGHIPGMPGTRTGLGVGGSFSCGGGGCCFNLKLGIVASAVWPSSGKPCFAGRMLAGFRCMKGAGVAISGECWKYWPRTGKVERR